MAVSVEGVGQLNLLSFSDEAVCSSQFSVCDFSKSPELSNKKTYCKNNTQFYCAS